MAQTNNIENDKKFWFIYRNYFPSRWVFFNGKDKENLYDEDLAIKWYNKNESYMTEIEIIRPPKKKVSIWLPLGNLQSEPVKEDTEFAMWLAKVKIEPRLGYVLDQILDEYYYWVDGLFYLREKKDISSDKDYSAIFSMREVINWIFRISPIKVRVAAEKETQKMNFIPWDISDDVYGVEFNLHGRTYQTNLFGLYGWVFRQALFPNSDFDWHTLMKWQREVYMGMGNITVVKAPRSWGKSLFATHLCALYLFKEINMPHEYDRPFLIVYGGLSKEANMQVVDYLKDMAKRITTNKHILNFNKSEMMLTLYDWHNERKVKFVSQGQEWQWFRGLRPHLVILDEASRLNKAMYDVAAGTFEAPILVISTTNADDERGWFEELYKEWVARQRLYKPIEEAIKETWIKYGFDKIKNKNDLQDYIDRWLIKTARDEIRMSRSIVSFKYTIYDVEYLTPEEIQMQIDKYSWDEDACLAELFNEINSGSAIYSADGLIDGNVPNEFEYVSIWYDHAETWDNPALVCTWYRAGKVYVYHSELLDKDDVNKRYEQIQEALRDAERRAQRVSISWDFWHGGKTLLREFESQVRAPDYPWIWTSAQNDEIKRNFPFYYIGKKYTQTLIKDKFFRSWLILFDEVLDVEWWLIEEMANFKWSWRKAIKWVKGKSDDQVNAMMLSLLWLYKDILQDEQTNQIIRWDIIEAKRIRAMQKQKQEEYDKLRRSSRSFRAKFW